MNSFLAVRVVHLHTNNNNNKNAIIIKIVFRLFSEVWIWILQITCLLAVTASTQADGGLGLGHGLEGLIYAPGHASADYYVCDEKFTIKTCV